MRPPLRGEMLHHRPAEVAAVELSRSTVGEPLERRCEIGHDDSLTRRDAAMLSVDRPPLGRVAQDQVEDRVQVRLRPGELHSAAGERDRGLEEPAPGQRSVALVRRLEPGDGPRHGAGAGADEEHLRRRTVEVDVDRLHVGLHRAAGAAARQRDEEVEEAVGSVPGAVHEQEAAGRGPGQRAFRDPGGESGRQARIDRIAALGEDLGARLGGEPVPGGDRPSHRREG